MFNTDTGGVSFPCPYCQAGEKQLHSPSCPWRFPLEPPRQKRFSFFEYHEAIKASVLPQYPNYGDNIIYPALGAADEAGEIAEKAILALCIAARTGAIAGGTKKLWRDHGIGAYHQVADLIAGVPNSRHPEGRPINEENKIEVGKLLGGIMKEIGDVLWYLDALAHTLNSSLEECARLNIIKLTGRLERGTTAGSGDDR